MKLGRNFVSAMMVALVTACGGDKPATRVPARPDSSSGEVAQYALMKNSIGWLTDSNVVALATQVNADAQGVSRLESQEWTREPFRLLSSEIMRDHARMQASIDSVASLRRIPSQLPAVAPELKAPYDSLLNAQAGLPIADREARFVDMLIKEHERSLTDFAALAGNATEPDLKALLANRAVLMEQTHMARARLMAGALAEADSLRQDSLKTARRGGRP
jgi:hypothetical protein